MHLPRRASSPLTTRSLAPLLILASALSACGKNGELPAATLLPAQDSIDARVVHDAALVFDGHADVLLPDTPKRYYLPDGGKRTKLGRLQQGGVDAIVFSIAVGPGAETPEAGAKARSDADAKLAAVRAWLADAGDKAALALTADDVERLQREGKVAVVLGFQNARILGNDLAVFDRYHEAGVRIAGLTHAGHNGFADSSRPQAGEPAERHGGLSALGKQAVQRFNDLGVLLDVSQLTPAGLKQAVSLSRAPVVPSHSNVRALIESTRNLGDDELDAIKAGGGVVLVTPFNRYLHDPTADEITRIADVRASHGLSRDFDLQDFYAGVEALPADKRAQAQDALKQAEARANVSELVDHIDYIAKRLGVAHVGIGSDFDHGAGIDGFDSPTDAPNVTGELLRRGYTQPEINAIWGGNLLRVLRESQDAARS